MLIALVEGLPEGSYLFRVQNEGRYWSSELALLWRAVQHLERHEVLWGVSLSGKKQKLPKMKKFPWSPDDGTKTWGKVAKDRRPAALAFLMSRKPTKDE